MARVEHIYGFSVGVRQLLGAGAVVMAVVDEVEARDVLGHPFHGVLTSKGMVFRQVLCHGLPSRVEQAYHQVGMLFLLDELHPFVGGGFELIETQSRTQSVGYPCDYIGCQQTEHGNLIAIALEHFIRCEIRLACGFVDDIGGQHGHLGLRIHAVEHLATCLDVVVAHACDVVGEIVQHFGDQVRMLGILVGAILERRALHVVAVVQEDKPVA